VGIVKSVTPKKSLENFVVQVLLGTRYTKCITDHSNHFLPINSSAVYEILEVGTFILQLLFLAVVVGIDELPKAILLPCLIAA
jgi:hypothetical protein